MKALAVEYLCKLDDASLIEILKAALSGRALPGDATEATPP
jgi:hypothetical protein